MVPKSLSGLIIGLWGLAYLTPLLAQYAGSKACQSCHAANFAGQSQSGHAHALALAPPGSPGHWAFGAGKKATTYVSQTSADTIAEHGSTYFASTKSMGLTPGHADSGDVVFRTFDPVGTVLRCFRCHSTGPLNLSATYTITPSETGVRCEACHGPGGAHVKSGGAENTILNPARLRAEELNELCGACHRQASDLDDDTNWSNAWNVRHQPSYLHRAACFRNSKGAVSCLTCHNPHEPLRQGSTAYDAKCASCHRSVTHTAQISGRSCVGCHMPQVTVATNLEFTNHWIGIYDGANANLMPVRRAVKTLQPSSAPSVESARFLAPSSPSTLRPVYEKALALRAKELGPQDPKVARSASDLGLFLAQTGDAAGAEAPLRKALAIDQANKAPELAADRENLAGILEKLGKGAEAGQLYRQAAAGSDAKVAARSYASLARLDSPRAAAHLRNAIDAMTLAYGKDNRRVAVLLHQLALVLREHGDDGAAEPLLRRALTIQETAASSDQHLTVEILNALGNLIEGARQFDQAEILLKRALLLAEREFGPESVELSATCTNLADVLWNKHDLAGAELLYGRALAADSALYGANRPEAAADMANLGMLLKEAGRQQEAATWLRQALEIFEKSLGPDSPQANLVRQGLAK